MFIWYKELIEKLFAAVFSGSGEAVSFMDYLSVVGLSLLLVLMSLLVVAVIGGSLAGPFVAYRKLLAGAKKVMKEFNENSNHEAFEQIKRKLRNRKVLFWCLFAFLYIPVAIPTVLYVLSLIINFFT